MTLDVYIRKLQMLLLKTRQEITKCEMKARVRERFEVKEELLEQIIEELIELLHYQELVVLAKELECGEQ